MTYRHTVHENLLISMDMWTTSFLNKNNEDVYEQNRITESKNLNQYKPSGMQLKYTVLNYHT